MGLHTCDRRSTASVIASEFPEYRIEPDFAEEDLLYDPTTRESNEERNQRLIGLLNDIFASDDNVFVSLTAHSGAITSILEVTGHRKFPLATGAVIPVVVKAEKIGRPAPPRHGSGPDPVVMSLAEKAAEDPVLEGLMKAVASSQASPEQVQAFQGYVDDMSAKV